MCKKEQTGLSIQFAIHLQERSMHSIVDTYLLCMTHLTFYIQWSQDLHRKYDFRYRFNINITII